MTLPIAAEVHRRAAARDQAHHRADLLAGAVPAMIFAPRQFPRIPDQIDPGDVMIMADLAAPRPGEEGLRPVGAGVVVGVLDRIRRVSKRACSAFHAAASSAWTVVARSTRALMK